LVHGSLAVGTDNTGLVSAGNEDTTPHTETTAGSSLELEDHCHQTGGVSQTVAATLLPSAADEGFEQQEFNGSILMPVARRPMKNAASNLEENVSEVPGAEHSVTVSTAEHTASAIDDSPRTPDWFREFVNSEGEQ
jgi:hypothetical protein